MLFKQMAFIAVIKCNTRDWNLENDGYSEMASRRQIWLSDNLTFVHITRHGPVLLSGVYLCSRRFETLGLVFKTVLTETRTSFNEF